jgi:LPXTG-motif cell wall-anchored protein
VLPVPTPPSTDEPGEFTPIVKSDCTTLVIGIDNPANGPTWTLTYETSKGEKRQDVVKPGQKKTETFSAVPGFSVKLTLAVTYKGKTYSDFTTLTYQKPSDCGGAGGGLPVTGAAAGGIAGGAAGLLAIGAVLFVMARRRKVRFTA